MIKIKRTEAPAILRGSPLKGNRYNNKKVVHALWQMQKEKCCYCEQSIPNEGHAKAVEHFEPKSIFGFRRNDWKNLLLACAQCNGSKSDKFPVELTNDNNFPKVVYLKKTSSKKKGRTLLIDPSNPIIDPEDHIDFIVDESEFEQLGLPKEKNNSPLGRTTIKIINLHAMYYNDQRRTFLVNTLLPNYNNLLIASNARNTDIIQTYKDRLKMYMAATQEFAAVTRAFCRAKKLDKPPFNIPIPRGHE